MRVYEVEAYKNLKKLNDLSVEDKSSTLSMDSFETKGKEKILPKFSSIEGSDFIEKEGAKVGETGDIGYFDHSNYLKYGPIDFGELGDTKGLILEYSKGNDYGTMEIRIDDPYGPIIAEFNPANTYGFEAYRRALIGLKEVSGVHYFCLVAKGNNGVLNISSMKLSSFADRIELFARVYAMEYTDQLNTKVGPNGIEYFDHDDYVTYSSINFGKKGTSKSIVINYAKDNHGGMVEMRIGGLNGTTIGTFYPDRTGGWDIMKSKSIVIDDVEGIHDVTFVGKGVQGVMNLYSFQLSGDDLIRPKFSSFKGCDYSEHCGPYVTPEGIVRCFNSGGYVKYGPVNFGLCGETKGLILEYSKNGDDRGSIEIRLDGPTGAVIAEFNPANTCGWNVFRKALIGLTFISGVHYVCVVANGVQDVLYIASITLSDFADRSKQYAKVLGTEFANQCCVKVGPACVHGLSYGAYITYSSINFGKKGTSKRIVIIYANNYDGGKVEMRLGGLNGASIGTFNFIKAQQENVLKAQLPADNDVEGIHDVTFIGMGVEGPMSLYSFQLSG